MRWPLCSSSTARSNSALACASLSLPCGSAIEIAASSSDDVAAAADGRDDDDDDVVD